MVVLAAAGPAGADERSREGYECAAALLTTLIKRRPVMALTVSASLLKGALCQSKMVMYNFVTVRHSTTAHMHI